MRRRRASGAGWDTGAGLGREKIFEVRRTHNDLTFIDTFLTLDFVREQRLFKFGYNESAEQYEIESRAFPKVKQQLLSSLTNAGRPIIAVVDGNHRQPGRALLEHDFAGVELDLREAQDTLRNLHRLWTRPVHIEDRARRGRRGGRLLRRQATCEVERGDADRAGRSPRRGRDRK